MLDADTHQVLQDPMQEDLWWNTQFCLIVRECFQQVERKEQIQGLEYEDCPKAIRVPANDTGILEAKAFFSTARLRHVKVDPAFHMVSRQARRYCHSLRIVKLPDTVVAIGYAAFQGCYSLMTVEMPGCLAIGAIIGQHAFEECAKLAQLSLALRAMMDALRRPPPRQVSYRGASTRVAFSSGARQ